MYNTSTRYNCLDEVVGSNVVNAVHKIKHWVPPPIGWPKWNIDASKIGEKKSSTSSYVYRDSTGHILFTIRKTIRDHHIFVVEILAIRKVIMTIIQK